MFKGRKVYEWFLEGAKEGLMVCVKIFPALLAMMIAIRIFKDANLLNYLNNLLEPIVSLIGLPKDIVPLVLIKPIYRINKYLRARYKGRINFFCNNGRNRNNILHHNCLLWGCWNKENKAYFLGRFNG